MLNTYPGFDDEKLLRMRLDRFWLLHRNVDRIAAERDIRNLRVNVSAAAPTSVRETFEGLRKELGDVAVFDEGRAAAARAHAEKLDSEGLRELAGLGGIVT